MEDFSSIRDGLIQLFSDDPHNWVKWIIVFTAFVLTFVIRLRFKLDDLVDPRERIKKKVKKAAEQHHVITAKLVQYRRWQDDDSGYSSRGDYQYELDGKFYCYSAHFDHAVPPDILHLYYNKSPTRLFTDEKPNGAGLWVIPMAILAFSPFLVGAFMVWILGLAG